MDDGITNYELRITNYGRWTMDDGRWSGDERPPTTARAPVVRSAFVVSCYNWC